jgi:hypothetical protein
MSQGRAYQLEENSSQGHGGCSNRLLVLACWEPWSRRREGEILTPRGARPAQPVPLALAPPTTDTAATYQPQSPALGRVCGVGEESRTEYGSSIGAGVGIERVFFDGPGRCLRKCGPRSAVSSVGQVKDFRLCAPGPVN